MAFSAEYDGIIYAVALWHNPSARCLPHDWLELRRMAVSPDAPHCTASWFLQAMARRIHTDYPACPRLISYQDMHVHTGTIYKAAGWVVGYISKARIRDRSKPRVGTERMYRSNLNGSEPDAAPKARWEKVL